MQYKGFHNALFSSNEIMPSLLDEYLKVLPLLSFVRIFFWCFHLSFIRYEYLNTKISINAEKIIGLDSLLFISTRLLGRFMNRIPFSIPGLD